LEICDKNICIDEKFYITLHRKTRRISDKKINSMKEREEEREEMPEKEEAIVSAQPESDEEEVSGEAVYRQEDVDRLVREAYLRGRNEQIEAQYVSDTSGLAANDGVPEAVSVNCDGGWIHTRPSVW